MPKRSQTPPKYPNHLREQIHNNGLRLTEVAQETDIPIRTLSDYCAGKLRIPRQRLEEFARIIGCVPEEIVPKYEPGEASAEHTTFYWHIPYPRNPFFTGREQLLQELYETFNANNAMPLTHIQALCGLGGVGKTHLALEYAYRYHHGYDAVFWLKADTRENLLADYLVLARLLNLPEQHAQEQILTIQAVLRWLETHTRWLLIFDNADDLSILPPFMPPAFGGHMLLTTRAQAVKRLAHRVTVECMTVEIGTLLLLRRAGILSSQAPLEQTSATHRLTAFQIVEELGGLPLAIDQVGAYIEETAYHLEGYLKLYHKQHADLLKRRGSLATDHVAPVATTWTLSFERIEQTDPLATSILRLCAFLDPDAIPEEILIEGLQEYVPVEGLPVDELRINAAIEVLLRFSLIQRNTETHMLTIHRLVQIVIQDSMDEETQRVWAERTVQAVNRVISRTITAYSTTGHPSRAVQLLKTSIYIHRKRGDKSSLAVALRNLATQQQVLGKLLESEQSLQENLTLCRDTCDKLHEATTHRSFALLRAYQGRFEDATQHLDIALSLIQEMDAITSEGAVWAYRSLCALLAEDISSAFSAATKARMLAEEQQNERDIIRSEWLLGWTSIRLVNQEGEQAPTLLQKAELHLRDAMSRCRRTNMVDYEADLLLANARLYFAKGENNRAKRNATEALTITNRSDFRVLRADVYNLLAEVAMKDGNWQEAQSHAEAAYNDALCNGIPYSYLPALEKAKQLLHQIQHSNSARISH